MKLLDLPIHGPAAQQRVEARKGGGVVTVHQRSDPVGNFWYADSDAQHHHESRPFFVPQWSEAEQVRARESCGRWVVCGIFLCAPLCCFIAPINQRGYLAVISPTAHANQP
jgi:hypothetical protein